MAYDYAAFPFVPPPGLTAPEPRHPVAIIGAGPIGLALAIDLAQRGIASVVLDDNNVVSVGSRAICWAKRSLELFDRLGVADRMMAKGVTWQVGRQFHGDKEVFSFDLLPEDGHKYPAFINLQQYYVEQYLVERAQDFPGLIDLRFLNKVTAHEDRGAYVKVSVETPEGAYQIEATYLIACDGAGSATRTRMGLDFSGQTFDEQFLIADIEMETSPFGDKDVPERWFWFDPPFHAGKSALLHQQPDNIYRIDLQLDADADAKAESRAEKVLPRIRAIVGARPFRLDWVSVYRFRCIQLEQFVHGRVIFAGDSAHVVSPFGARGGNGGIQDVDNLGWKLAAILHGTSPPSLIQSYNEERVHASRENLLNSARATNFMTPKSPAEALLRAEALRLAHDQPFARRLLNSGRLSVPCALTGLSLQTPSPQAPVAPGTAIPDAPLVGGDGPTWLISEIPAAFALLTFGQAPLGAIDGVQRIGIGHQNPDYPCFDDPNGHAERRFGNGWVYLLRPDSHVAAAFHKPAPAQLRQALERAQGKDAT